MPFACALLLIGEALDLDEARDRLPLKKVHAARRGSRPGIDSTRYLGHIGLAQQLREPAARRPGDGQSGRRVHADLYVAQAYGCGEACQHRHSPVRGRLGRGHIGEQDRERVSVQPRDQAIRADRRGQAPRHLDQHPVPGNMAERVVDLAD
jgi:hypothetical protein